MKTGRLSSFSPQTISCYQLLLKQSPLTAKEIGGNLKIFPHAVYRIIANLRMHGCVKSLKGRPEKYFAVRVPEALEVFLITNRVWFTDNFLPFNRVKLKNNIKRNNNYFNLTIISGREEVYQKLARDLRNAKNEVDLIVSGLEASSENILETKRAIERGVKIKVLVQKYDKENIEMLHNWQKLGSIIRLLYPIYAQIFIIDSVISYLVLIDPQDEMKRMGVRIEHQEISCFLKKSFNFYWENSKKL